MAKKMSKIILLPLRKLDLKLPLSGYGINGMLLAELRQYIFSSIGVEVPFLTLMDLATSVLSIAEIVMGELGKVVGKKVEWEVLAFGCFVIVILLSKMLHQF